MGDLEVFRRTAISNSHLGTSSATVLHQTFHSDTNLRDFPREFDFGQNLGDDPLSPLLDLVHVEVPIVVKQLLLQVCQNRSEPVLLGHGVTRGRRPPLDADEALP